MLNSKRQLPIPVQIVYNRMHKLRNDNISNLKMDKINAFVTMLQSDEWIYDIDKDENGNIKNTVLLFKFNSNYLYIKKVLLKLCFLHIVR